MYDPYHPDANKALAKSQIGRAVGQLGYLGKGLVSTTGIDVGGIGGGTPGTRNIYERTLGLPAVQNIGRTIENDTSIQNTFIFVQSAPIH